MSEIQSSVNTSITQTTNYQHQQQQMQQQDHHQQQQQHEITMQYLTNLFENKMLANNNNRNTYFSKHQSNKPLLINKSIPFFINSQQLISDSQVSRIYKCDFIDNCVQQQVMENLLQIKDVLFSGQQPIDNQLKVKYNQSSINHMLTELYYKSINNYKKQNEQANNYYSCQISPLKCKIINLQQYRDGQINYIMGYLQKLKFFYQYNDIVHSKQFMLSQYQKKQKLNLKLFYFNLEHNKWFTPKIIKLIADHLQNRLHVQSTSLQSSNSNNQKKQSINSQTVTLLILDYGVDENYFIRQKAASILQTAIRKNYLLITVEFLEKLWSLMSHQLSQTKKTVIKLLKQCLFKLFQIKNYQQKPQFQQQQKLIQPKKLLKLMYFTCLALNQIQKPYQHQTKTKNVNSLYFNIQSDPQQIQKNRLKQQQEQNKLKESYVNQCLKKFAHQLKNNSSSYTVIKDQPINLDQLSEVLTKNYVTNVNFSNSLNIDLNYKLGSYQNYTVTQKIKQTTYKEEFLYVINEYHHGKTFKELILNNWRGFQNHDVVHKLATKLFWVYAKLQYCGFDEYVPTLQNIIINQNLNMPDININMTSFLNSIFLFQSNEFFKKNNSFDSKYLSQKVKRSSLEQLLPFIQSNGVGKGISKVNRIHNFLIILLFMVCRRLDHFQGLPSILKNLKLILQKDIETQTKIYKQMQEKNKKQQLQQNPKQETLILNQQLRKMKPLYDQTQKHSLVNTVKKIDFKESFDQIDRGHFFNLAFYVPQLFSVFLKKYQLPVQNVKQYEKISYQNSNNYRINSFQKYIGFNKNQLLNIFQKNLTSTNRQKTPNSTWRQLFCLLFVQGQYAIIQKSQFLAYLCRFFNYPLKKQLCKEKLSPQIYFALKFDIDFCYFQEKYHGRWFDCFETFSKQGKIQYNMETMCLLKNIKSQVIEITNRNVKKIIEKIQESSNFFVGSLCMITLIWNQNKSIYQKVKAGIDILKYLNKYEKQVYQSELRKAEEKTRSQKKIQSPKSQQKKLQYFTSDYFETFSEQDINQLQEILHLFMQKMNII